MVSAGRSNYAVPDNGLVGGGVTGDGGAIGCGRRPFGRNVDEELLGVPCEQGRQIGVKGELYDGVFFLLAAVVVRTSADSVQREESCK